MSLKNIIYAVTRLKMTHYQRLILTLIIIFVSLGIGYLAQQLQAKGKWKISDNGFTAVKKNLQRVAIFFLMPTSAMLSLWGLPTPGPSLLILPLVGTLSYIIGGWLAIKLGRLQRMPNNQLGAYYGCGAFTNLGAVGGLVCLMFLGENTIALVSLYRFFEEIYFFGVAYPVARSFGTGSSKVSFHLKQFKPHPGVAIIVAALACGIILNFSGVTRPVVFTPVASTFMITGTVCLLIGIGMNLRLSATIRYLRPAFVMCLIKFICLPFIITGLALCLGGGNLEGGLVIKTIFILSSMPVAMYALVPPVLFNLDIDLANTCWIITTLGLLISVPALMLILPHI